MSKYLQRRTEPTSAVGHVPPENGNSPGYPPAVSAGRELWGYVELLRRRWWIVVGSAVLAVGMAWWGQRNQVRTYTAEALLQQRQQEDVIPLTAGRSSEFGSQVEIIRSRAVIAPVVDSLGLQLSLLERGGEWTRIVGDLQADRTPASGAYSLVADRENVYLTRVATGDTISTATRDSATVEGPGFRLVIAQPGAIENEPVSFSVRDGEVAIQSLQRRIRVEPGKGMNLVRIGFSDPDPRLAAAIVNAVAESFQSHRANTAREAASRRRDVIAGQLVQLADSLRSVQDMLAGYQQEERFVDPGAEGSALFSARFQTETEIQRLRFEESLLQSLVASLRSADASTGRLEELLTRAAELVPSGRAIHSRLQNLQDERSRLTASRFGFTDKEPRVQVLDSLIAAAQNQMRVAAQQSLELARENLGAAQDRLGRLQHDVGSLPALTTEMSRFQQRVNAVQDVFDMLAEKYYEAQIAEGVEVGDVEVVDPAAVPLWPDPTHTGLSLMVALLAGLILGGAGAAVVDQFDSKVRGSEDAQSASRLEVLGQVPNLVKRSNGTEAALLGKEALRSIRANLRFATTEPLHTLAISSAEPREGKTTVSANLALSYAEQGLKTLLIDADVRRPIQHSLFQVKRAPGLTDVLAGKIEPLEAIQVSPLPGRLHLLSAGSPVENAPELIAAPERFEELLDQLKSEYEAIVIDTAPVLAVSDALIISTLVDGLVVVARSDRSDQTLLEEAVARLRRVKAPLIGIVLNAVKSSKVSYSYYSYYYNAQEREPERRPALLRAGSRSSQES